jgi:hypothetical protein
MGGEEGGGEDGASRSKEDRSEESCREEGRRKKGGGEEDDGHRSCTDSGGNGVALVGSYKTAASPDLDTFTVSAPLTFWRTESIAESWCSQILNTRHPSRFN